MKKNGNYINREEWLEEALICEKSENYITCEGIVRMVISLGLTN